MYIIRLENNKLKYLFLNILAKIKLLEHLVFESVITRKSKHIQNSWCIDAKRLLKSGTPMFAKLQKKRMNYYSSLPPGIGLLTYRTKVRPILEYASPVWGGIPKYLETEIERVQQRSLRILGLEKDTLPTLKERRKKATCNELKRIVEVPNNSCNRYLASKKNQTYELRRTRDSFPRQSSKTHRHSTFFIPRTCTLSNS
jgi:hypothetical protein